MEDPRSGAPARGAEQLCASPGHEQADQIFCGAAPAVDHQEQLERRKQQAAALPPLIEADLRELAEQARRYIPERMRYYSPMVGVDYGSIAVRCQKSRWGSRSSEGNLSFNCLLILTPPEVIDSVVVHKLCHRKEMNHSAAFYAHILRVFPEYRTWRRWLKDNGPALLLRRKGQVSGQVERAAYCAEYMFCLMNLFTTTKNARVCYLY